MNKECLFFPFHAFIITSNEPFSLINVSPILKVSIISSIHPLSSKYLMCCFVLMSIPSRWVSRPWNLLFFISTSLKDSLFLISAAHFSQLTRWWPSKYIINTKTQKKAVTCIYVFCVSVNSIYYQYYNILSISTWRWKVINPCLTTCHQHFHRLNK